MGTPSPQLAVSPTGTGSIESENENENEKESEGEKDGRFPERAGRVERGGWCAVCGVV
jgi:hypothetical protein